MNTTQPATGPTMVAKFRMTAERLDRMMIELDRRSAHHHKVDAQDLPNEPGSCLVAGAPQDLMFVIGEVAAQGEDCLVFVNTFPGGV